MYRYRDISGSTEKSLKTIKHLSKIGWLKYIKGYCYKGRYGVNHCAILLKGDKGSMRISNFSWGYNGQGPRGLEKFLKEINIDQKEIDRVLSVKWDGWDSVGEKWRINV